MLKFQVNSKSSIKNDYTNKMIWKVSSNSNKSFTQPVFDTGHNSSRKGVNMKHCLIDFSLITSKVNISGWIADKVENFMLSEETYWRKRSIKVGIVDFYFVLVE